MCPRLSHLSTCAGRPPARRGSPAPDRSPRCRRPPPRRDPAARPSSSPPSTPAGPAAGPRGRTDPVLPWTGAFCKRTRRRRRRVVRQEERRSWPKQEVDRLLHCHYLGSHAWFLVGLRRSRSRSQIHKGLIHEGSVTVRWWGSIVLASHFNLEIWNSLNSSVWLTGGTQHVEEDVVGLMSASTPNEGLCCCLKTTGCVTSLFHATQHQASCTPTQHCHCPQKTQVWLCTCWIMSQGGMNHCNLLFSHCVQKIKCSV